MCAVRAGSVLAVAGGGRIRRHRRRRMVCGGGVLEESRPERHSLLCTPQTRLQLQLKPNRKANFRFK